MINLDDIFSKSAFKSIEKERLELFKNFAKKIEGKNINDALLDIISFFNSFPKGKELSNKEREAIIESIILSLPQKEQKQFLSILELMGNI